MKNEKTNSLERKDISMLVEAVKKTDRAASFARREGVREGDLGVGRIEARKEEIGGEGGREGGRG